MRQALLLSCVPILTLWSVTARAARPDIEKPNIVIVFTDDK